MVTVTATSRLVKMSDEHFETRTAAEDIRGRRVLDRDGHEIGKVQDLFVDDAERHVRFLQIRSGGFLGIGAKELLIPADAIARVDQNIVHLDQTRERIAGAPVYDPHLHKDINWADYCHYYGCTPYWEREER
jgi:sporulation protein YlmC with PRC-barrel domain